VLAVGDGVSTPSQSLVNAYEPGDVRKTPLLFFAGTTLYDGRVVPTTVETLDITFYSSSAYTDAWETDANIKYLRYASINEG
jgi:hypothetical protein